VVALLFFEKTNGCSSELSPLYRYSLFWHEWWHSLQIEIWNTVISGDFIKFSECQVPMRKCKAPYSDDFLATLLV